MVSLAFSILVKKSFASSTPINYQKASDYTYAIDRVLLHEGGLTIDDSDSGGATNLGISLRFLKMSNTDVNNDGIVNLKDIFAINKEVAVSIYLSEFWFKNRLNMISDKEIAAKVLDMTVHIGAFEAIKILQSSVNTLYIPTITIDGVCGTETLESLDYLVKNNQKEKLLNQVRSELAQFYRDLTAKNPTNEKYIKGWLKRAFS